MNDVPTYKQAIGLVEKGEPVMKPNPYAPKLTDNQRIAIVLLYHQFNFSRAVLATCFNVHPRTITSLTKSTGFRYKRVRDLVEQGNVGDLIRRYIPEELYNSCVKLRDSGVTNRTVMEGKFRSTDRKSFTKLVVLPSAGGLPNVEVVVRSINLMKRYTFGMPNMLMNDTTPEPVWGYSVSNNVYGHHVDADDVGATYDNIFICRHANPNDTDRDIQRTGNLFKSPEQAVDDAVRNYRIEERFGITKNED